MARLTWGYGKATARPGWYDDPDSGLGHQAYWDGENWTGATRGLARHAKRFFVFVLVLATFYGSHQLSDTLTTFGWVETSGRVVDEPSWYNGFSTERGFIVAHQDGRAFLYEAKDDRLRVGDHVTFYFDPGQPYFIEGPRAPNAFQDETTFPKVNAALTSPLSHTRRAVFSLTAVAGLIIVILWLHAENGECRGRRRSVDRELA